MISLANDLVLSCLRLIPLRLITFEFFGVDDGYLMPLSPTIEVLEPLWVCVILKTGTAPMEAIGEIVGGRIPLTCVVWIAVEA